MPAASSGCDAATPQQSRMMFEKLYEYSPDAIVVVDEMGKIDRVNVQAEALFGLPRERMLGQSVEMLVPERSRDRHLAHRVNYMKDPKTRPMGSDLQLLAQRADGSEFPVDIMLSPIEIDERRVTLAVVRDITERKRAEAHLQLLMREVNHRAKNILSVVQAIAQRTLASSSQEFISRFSERIQGLSASNDLLVRNQWQNVPLAELVRSQLAHFADLLESRIAVRGPDLRITAAAAQVIGMALHELATNAGKYGALSTDTGHVDVVWRLERADAGGRRFLMEWSENGGPTVVAPTRRGFGWSVLCQLTKESLGADVILEYAPTGVVWRLGCPADRVLDRLVGECVQRHARVRREPADLRIDLPDVAQFAERALPVEVRMALGLAVQRIGLAVGEDEQRKGGGARHPHLRHSERPLGPEVLRRDRDRVGVAPGQGEKYCHADSSDADRSPIDPHPSPENRSDRRGRLRGEKNFRGGLALTSFKPCACESRLFPRSPQERRPGARRLHCGFLQIPDC